MRHAWPLALALLAALAFSVAARVAAAAPPVLLRAARRGRALAQAAPPAPRAEGPCDGWCAANASEGGDEPGGLPACRATLKVAVAMPYAHGLSPQRATRAASALLACQHLRELDGRVVGANTAQRIREAGLGLECELYDTQFDAQAGLNAALEAVVNNESHALVGSARSAVTGPMSEVTTFFGVPQVSHASTASDLTRSGKLLARTVISDASVAVVTAELVASQDWSYVAFFAPNDEYGLGWKADFELAAAARNITLLASEVYETSSDSTPASAASVMRAINSTRATIIVGIMFSQDAEAIFASADYYGLLEEGFAWITADGLTAAALEEASDPEALSRRMTGLLQVVADPTLSPLFGEMVAARYEAPTCIYLGDDTLQELDTVALANDGIHPFAAYAYDAVWALALAATEVDPELLGGGLDTSEARGEAIYESLLRQDFAGASGDVVRFDTNAEMAGDRDVSAGVIVAVRNWQDPVESGGGGSRQADDGGNDGASFVLVGILNQTTQRLQRIVDDSSGELVPIIWPGNTTSRPIEDLKPLPPPTEETSSGSDKDNTVAIAVGVSVGVAALLALLLIGVLLYRSTRAKVWVIQPSDLVFDKPPVILGYGAHGEVVKGYYHGTPVAVKQMLQKTKQMLQKTSSGDQLSRSLSHHATLTEFSDSDRYCRWPSVRWLTCGLCGTSSPSDDRRRQSFEQEIDLLVRLRHPNIVAMLGVVTMPGADSPSLVLELMEQGSLRACLTSSISKVAAEPTVSLKVLMGTAVNAAAGLRYLHAQSPPVVHGDIKSGNIMIDRKFTGKLGDFGLASGASGAARTRSGGTPLWIAPENLDRDALAASVAGHRQAMRQQAMREGGGAGSHESSANSEASVWHSMVAGVASSRRQQRTQRRTSCNSVGSVGSSGSKASIEGSDEDYSTSISVGGKTELFSDAAVAADSGVDSSNNGEAAATPTSAHDDAPDETRHNIPSTMTELRTIAGQTIAHGAITARGSANTPASDVFAVGILLYEMVARAEPYHDQLKHLRLDELLLRVSDPSDPLRPCKPPWHRHSKAFKCPVALLELMAECWHPNPLRRPSAAELHERLEAIERHLPEPPPPPMDAGRRVLAQFGDSLPKGMANALRAGQRPEPVSFDRCSCVFSDIKGFTKLSATLPPKKVDDMVHRLFQRFEEAAERWSVTKIDTIGDCFVAVAGLPRPRTDHVLLATLFAHDCARAAAETLIDIDDPARGVCQVRIGVNSGPVVAGVTGGKFTIYGDTVNKAARMEALSAPGRVTVSETTRQALLETAESDKARAEVEARLVDRGRLKVKLEQYQAYFLEAPPISSRSVLCPPQAVDSLMSIPEYESDEATAVSSKAVSDEVASIDGSNDMAMGAV